MNKETFVCACVYLSVVAIFVLIFPTAVTRSSTNDPFVSPLGSPPWGDVYQLMECSDFECGYTPGNWKFRMDADLSSVNPAYGNFSAHVGGISALGVIDQEIDLTGCKPGNVWVHVLRDAIPASLPWPEDQLGHDYSDVYISKDYDMVAWLYRMYDYETFNGIDYEEVWYLIPNLFDVCSGNECTLRLTAVNDDGDKSVDWDWDNVEVYCLAPTQVWHIYLPFISR